MELYRDFYGCTAAIRTAKSGAARLTVRNSGGKLIHAKDYKTYRGAKVAMVNMIRILWHEFDYIEDESIY